MQRVDSLVGDVVHLPALVVLDRVRVDELDQRRPVLRGVAVGADVLPQRRDAPVLVLGRARVLRDAMDCRLGLVVTPRNEKVCVTLDPYF